MFTRNHQALGSDLQLCGQRSKAEQNFSWAVECNAATTNESGRSNVSGNVCQGRLTCVTRPTKEQHQPLLEAVSVSPSCHEESWHFHGPSRRAPSSLTSQPVASNPSAAHMHFNQTASLCAQLQHTHSAHPSSPSSAQHLCHLQQPHTACSQWPSVNSLDAPAPWQQDPVHPYRATLAQHRCARPCDNSTAWSPCKRQCTSLPAAQQQHRMLQPLSTQAKFGSYMRCNNTPLLHKANSPISHLHTTADTATVPDILGLHSARCGAAAAPDMMRMHSAAQQPAATPASRHWVREDIPQLGILQAHSRRQSNPLAAQHIQQQQWRNLGAAQDMHAAHSSAIHQQRRRDLSDIMVHMPWLQSACESKPSSPHQFMTSAPAPHACTAQPPQDIIAPRGKECGLNQPLQPAHSLTDLQAIYASCTPVDTLPSNAHTHVMHAAPPPVTAHRQRQTQSPRDGHAMWFAEQLVELSGLLNSEVEVPQTPAAMPAHPDLDAQSCMDGSGSVTAGGVTGAAAADSAAAVNAAAFAARTACSLAPGCLDEGSDENEPVLGSSTPNAFTALRSTIRHSTPLI